MHTPFLQTSPSPQFLISLSTLSGLTLKVTSVFLSSQYECTPSSHLPIPFSSYSHTCPAGHFTSCKFPEEVCVIKVIESLHTALHSPISPVFANPVVGFLALSCGLQDSREPCLL